MQGIGQQAALAGNTARCVRYQQPTWELPLMLTTQRFPGFSVGTCMLSTAGAGLLSQKAWSLQLASMLPKGSSKQHTRMADLMVGRDVPAAKPCGSHIVRRRYLQHILEARNGFSHN
jgi:hypothetical protein